jgi:hypothetical protein
MLKFTIWQDEVEERWVTVKVYESEDDEDEDPVVRVTITPIADVEGRLEQDEHGQTPVAEADAADRSITLEPDPVEDLEEELIEIGFSREAAAWILRKASE